MPTEEKSQDVSERPSGIVRIAYHQINVMRGIEDLSTETKSDEKADGCCEYTKRLFESPMFISVSSTFSNTYETIKDSHEFVTLVLNDAEDRLRAGVDFISPYTSKMGDAIYTSLEFFKKEAPSVELPSNGIYDNISDFVRLLCANAMTICGDLFVTMRDSLTRLAITTSETTNDSDRNPQSQKTRD